MSDAAPPTKRVAIACGGTGGHLFPGLAVAGELVRQNCAVTLLVSPKEVDQQALKDAAGFNVVTLPAVGLVRGRALDFLRGLLTSYRLAATEFRRRAPNAVLAMGGFTSAPPVLAGRRCGARTFLHESNTIPGRANRWLSWIVDLAFVGFPSAADSLHTRRVNVTGTPVRSQFKPADPGSCRTQLGLDAARPVILVMGGSQGAAGINELVTRALPQVAKLAPRWQWLHLTGPADQDKVSAAYSAASIHAVVHPFFSPMNLALGAATLAISRAGASSLAELAQMQLPSILIPYPAATDNHQYFNARAYEQTGAAALLQQRSATPESLVASLMPLMNDTKARLNMQHALQSWRKPQAAREIAETVLAGASDPSCLKNPFSEKTGCRTAGSGSREDNSDRLEQRRNRPMFVKLDQNLSHD